MTAIERKAFPCLGIPDLDCGIICTSCKQGSIRGPPNSCYSIYMIVIASRYLPCCKLYYLGSSIMGARSNVHLIRGPLYLCYSSPIFPKGGNQLLCCCVVELYILSRSVGKIGSFGGVRYCLNDEISLIRRGRFLCLNI